MTTKLKINYIVGKDNISVIIITEKGEFKTYHVTNTPEYAKSVLTAIKEAQITGQAETLYEFLSPAYRISHLTDGRFEFDGFNSLYLKDTKVPIPELLAERILEFVDKNKEEGLEIYPLESLVKFWYNCLLNTDPVAVAGLYRFLEHNGHPITSNGYFIGYKRVNIKKKYSITTGEVIETKIYDENTGELLPQSFSDALEFVDTYTGKITYKAGNCVAIPREECDSNPEVTCSAGLHVGSMAYVGDFGSKEGPVVECLVNPRHVVAVPVDYNGTKMRVCQLYVLGLCNGERTTNYMESDYGKIDIAQLKAEYEAKIHAAAEEKEKNEALIHNILKN